MGGLGPGIGGLEILVIGLVALLVVGPKDLPVLMRKVGQFMARARAMANEFRASFDEMARQSELDELRREVQALKSGANLHPLGAEAEAAFRDIQTDLNAPLAAPAPAAAEAAPIPSAPAPVAAPPAKPARKRAAPAKTPSESQPSEPKAVKPAARKPRAAAPARKAPVKRAKTGES